MSIVGKKVSWLQGTRKYGVVMDKVNIPLASGTDQYCPMDNYKIEEYDEYFHSKTGKLHTVNPLFVDTIL